MSQPNPSVENPFDLTPRQHEIITDMMIDLVGHLMIKVEKDAAFSDITAPKLTALAVLLIREAIDCASIMISASTPEKVKNPFMDALQNHVADRLSHPENRELSQKEALRFLSLMYLKAQ